MKKLFSGILLAILVAPVAQAQTISACRSHHRDHILEFVTRTEVRLANAHQMVLDYRDEVISHLPVDQQALYFALPEHFNTGYPRAADVRRLAEQQKALYPVDQYPEIYWLWQHIYRTSNYDLYARTRMGEIKEYRANVEAGVRMLDFRTPFHSTGRNGQQQNIQWQLTINIPEKLLRLTKEGPQINPVLLADALHMTLQAGEAASWVLWHHTDATLDEEYLDPAFGMCYMGGM